jgi:hypothetical protein
MTPVENSAGVFFFPENGLCYISGLGGRGGGIGRRARLKISLLPLSEGVPRLHKNGSSGKFLSLERVSSTNIRSLNGIVPPGAGWFESHFFSPPSRLNFSRDDCIPRFAPARP